MEKIRENMLEKAEDITKTKVQLRWFTNKVKVQGRVC